ncbi:hypothetical protein [Lentzea sp. E54]|uniref:hypothetical protein n=1 Tax=Lentzea xerophila TaxID=3435883 RepID=UPI003DA47A9A
MITASAAQIVACSSALTAALAGSSPAPAEIAAAAIELHDAVRHREDLLVNAMAPLLTTPTAALMEWRDAFDDVWPLVVQLSSNTAEEIEATPHALAPVLEYCDGLSGRTERAVVQLDHVLVAARTPDMLAAAKYTAWFLNEAVPYLTDLRWTLPPDVPVERDWEDFVAVLHEHGTAFDTHLHAVLEVVTSTSGWYEAARRDNARAAEYAAAAFRWAELGTTSGAG